MDAYATGGQFFDALASDRQDCLLLDFEMPAMSGVDVMKHLDRLKIRIPTIILTAQDDVASRKACQDAGAMDYLCKPVNADRLLDGVRDGFALRACDRLGIQGVEDDDSIVGDDDPAVVG